LVKLEATTYFQANDDKISADSLAAADFPRYSQFWDKRSAYYANCQHSPLTCLLKK